jgi:hypothetical protein
MFFDDEIRGIFKKVFGIFPDFFSVDVSIDLIQTRMEQAEKENDQRILQYQDNFNEITFHYGLILESAGIEFH